MQTSIKKNPASDMSGDYTNWHMYLHLGFADACVTCHEQLLSKSMFAIITVNHKPSLETQRSLTKHTFCKAQISQKDN